MVKEKFRIVFLQNKEVSLLGASFRKKQIFGQNTIRDEANIE
jgi:hypothetical protein